MFRLVLMLSLILSIGFTPSVAHAGWLDFFFPAPEKKEPNPAETLRAPFADEDAVIVDLDAANNRDNSTPLHMRHRTNAVITQWVQEIVPQMLTYKTQEYENQYREKALTFSKVGGEEYVSFLHSANFITTLKTGRYDITGFIRDYPVIINEGVVDGRYKWLYETNIMVTFFESGMTEYQRDESRDNTITKEYKVTVQLGRSREAQNDHGLLIETWDVKAIN